MTAKTRSWYVEQDDRNLNWIGSAKVIGDWLSNLNDNELARIAPINGLRSAIEAVIREEKRRRRRA